MGEIIETRLANGSLWDWQPAGKESIDNIFESIVPVLLLSFPASCCPKHLKIIDS